MKARHSVSVWPARFAFVLGAVLAGSLVPVLAQDVNPFAPSSGTAAPPPVSSSPLDVLEMRGVMSMGDTTFVTIFDTSTSRTVVVALGGTANGLDVKEYNAADDTVLVQSGANTRWVPLRKAQITAMVVPPPQPVPQQGAGPVPPPGGSAGQPQIANQPPMGDEEVRARMERVASEIRRRREMRREMLERAQQQQPSR